MDYPGKVITKTQVTPTQTSASGNWTLDDQAAAIKNNNWPVALVPNPISKSLRFNSADSAYLNRTPAGSGTLGVWTFSFWVKRAALGVTQTVFFSGTTNQRGGIRFTSGDLINCQPFNSTGANASWTSTAVFRDPSAWYHVVIRAFSSATGNSFGGVELALYINGVQQTFTLGTTGTPTGGDRINDSQAKQIGQITPNGDGDYLSAYLTEFNFIDGQALTPSSFGMTNPQTGQWIPLKYSGTYGTNGFYVNFKDATSTTTLGYDYSGNANNWTTNNFSVTAGAGNDSLTDVPTPWFAYNTTGDVGGVIRGNYATFNALRPSGATLTNGNLDATTGTSGSANGGYLTATFWMPTSGKYYFEVTPTTVGEIAIGLTTDSNNRAAVYYRAGDVYINGSVSFTGSSYTNNDVIGVAVDMDALTIRFYKNNTAQGSGTSSLSAMTGPFVPAIVHLSGGGSATAVANFGQRPFAYTPPTGFRSLCTTNLPATAIGFGLTNQGDDYFDVSLWTGTGVAQSITNSGSMQPDFVWTKTRSQANDNFLFDAVRGVGKYIVSNSTAAESTVAQTLTAFNSNGFSVGTDNDTNASGRTFVGWQWRAAGSTVSNTAGTITSTVSANTTAGFSIVTYTGTGANATVGHGLGVAPAMFILKARSASGLYWVVYHQSLGATKALFLQLTDAANTDILYFNNTAPTSSVLSLGAGASPNQNGTTYVAYCFAAVPGYSAFGSYTGNGSADGPFVYLGFRPEFVLTKRTDGGGDNWTLHDAARSPYNVASENLRPNTSGAEGSYPMDFLSNGFKWRQGGGDGNESGASYIYVCFAESPFQFANAR